MSADEKSVSGEGAGKPAPKSRAARPDWSNGLRQLYDSVLDEELPDTFKDLLSKLDNKD